MYTRRTAPFTFDAFKKEYQRSITNPSLFWQEKARLLSWYSPYQTVFDDNAEQGNVCWFAGGKLNACYQCLDRHLPKHGNEIAIIWEGNELGQSFSLSYRQLHRKVCQFANALKARGAKKGDRICLYMPMIIEAAIAMLACARIGAVHSVVFGGFSPEALASRIIDADCKIVVTADEGLRGPKTIPLKHNVDQALHTSPQVHTVFVVRHTKANIAWHERDVDYHAFAEQQADDCSCEIMDAEDPLFILYTSGSTGKPKGVLHTTAGYLLYAMYTFQVVFDYRVGDRYWCTADIGWITGHSYFLYGPLANRATTLMHEGLLNYPDPSRVWQIIDKHHINIFYTAPTAIRALIAKGDAYLETTNRSSLRILGTVGEPINPDVWNWYFEKVGHGRCPIVDTWWQTETGGFLLTPIAGITPLKPGSATLPFYGIEPEIVDGKLYINKPWPGQMRTILGDHQRFIQGYFSEIKGKYFSGDGAKQDADGYYWVTGRVDDVMNISGHRIGTAEVEDALVMDQHVAEAAVVSIPHPIKGEGIYAFVILKEHLQGDNHLRKSLTATVSTHIGAFAKPEYIQFVSALPKTRSGKIMRRILRKIACGETNHLGDMSTLADPSVIQRILTESTKNTCAAT